MQATNEQSAGGHFDADFVEEWGQGWLAAWNTHDVDRVISMCTEDVRWSGPALPGAVHGHQGVRGSVAALFTAFPNVRIEAMEPPYISAENGKALSPYRFVGTMEGDWEPASIAATGAVVDFVGIDEWVFRGELLSRYDTHYDTLDVARQLGLLPPIGSRGDRMLARLQHVRARFQRHGEEWRWSVGTQVGWQ